MFRYKSLRDSAASLIASSSSWFGGASRRADMRTFWALSELNLSVAQGEVVGIIGRNGAGKSTLLKIISRITKPTTGGVELRGRVGSLLEVGTGFHPELTGRENVYLNGAILGMTRREVRRRFDEIVAFSEVERFLDTPVKQYSSGMYTRLAFAVAAHLEPEILVVDEVLAVGDVAFQRKCLGRMRDLSGEGRTVLFVSHNMASIAELCTRVVYLSGGRTVMNGPPDDVIAAYYRDAARAASAEDQVQLGGGMKLDRISVRPVAPVTGGRMQVEIAIGAEQYRRIERLYLLVSHQTAGRLFIVDLLKGRRLLDLPAGSVWKTRLAVEPLMLVPGTFTLGLHIADDAGARDRPEVHLFDVIGGDDMQGDRLPIASTGPLVQKVVEQDDELLRGASNN